MANDFPDDAILKTRAENFLQSYEQSDGLQQEVDDGRISPVQAKPLLDQYKRDRNLIAQWAESGPYVKESKAFMVGTAPLLLAIGGFAVYTWLYNRPIPKAKGSKSAFYGVFS
jgi:hypothetical protein